MVSKKPAVLLIHGTHCASAIFDKVLCHPELREKFQLLAFDRPGYGDSGITEPMLSVIDQSRWIAEVLKKKSVSAPVTVIGHSYGGEVAARLAIDCPGLVERLILIAPSMSPDLERLKWFEVIPQWPVLRTFMPRAWKIGAKESMHNREQLKAMMPDWVKIKCPVQYIHGQSDRIVSPKTAEFAREVLVSAPLSVSMIEGVGHNIPKKRPDLIVDAIFSARKA